MRSAGTLLVLALPLTAQRTTATIDVGTARMRFADTLNATAMSVSPAFQFVAPAGSFSAVGTSARLGSATSHSGLLDGTLSLVRNGSVWGEVQGIAGGSAHDDGTRTGQLLGLARLNLARTGHGFWLGGGAGGASDGTWRRVVQGDAGAWLERENAILALTITPTAVDTIRYTDVFLSARHEREPWELSGSVGLRAGSQLPAFADDRKTWGNVTATRWVSPNVAIIASAGAYPVDFTQGFPGGQFVSLSVRWRPISRTRTITTTDPAVTPSGVRNFQVRREGSDRYRLRVYAPTARLVELAGDFTSWRPVPLSPAGRGWWSTTFPVLRGTHEVNVRLDGGPWLVPPGLASLKDEFGGTSGLLVIP